MAKASSLTFVAALSMIFISSAVFAECGNSPFIVAHKRVSQRKLNSDLERLSISIDIYNAGSDSAYDVTLADDNWAQEVFDSIIGNTSNTWERLDPGSLVSHSFELESRVKTVYYGAPALITYRVPTKSKLQEAYSTPTLPVKILSEPTAENKIEIAKILNFLLFAIILDLGLVKRTDRLLARYGSHVSVVLLVMLFVNIIFSPSKANSATGNKKRR